MRTRLATIAISHTHFPGSGGLSLRSHSHSVRSTVRPDRRPFRKSPLYSLLDHQPCPRRSKASAWPGRAHGRACSVKEQGRGQHQESGTGSDLTGGNSISSSSIGSVPPYSRQYRVARSASARRYAPASPWTGAPCGGGTPSQSKRLQKESRMKILDSLVEMVQLVHGLARKVARHDRDLAQQMKRASSSTALNGSEGLFARAGKRTSRLEDAVNSARETMMALRLAGACGCLSSAEAQAGVLVLDGIIAVLWCSRRQLLQIARQTACRRGDVQPCEAQEHWVILDEGEVPKTPPANQQQQHHGSEPQFLRSDRQRECHIRVSPRRALRTLR